MILSSHTGCYENIPVKRWILEGYLPSGRNSQVLAIPYNSLTDETELQILLPQSRNRSMLWLIHYSKKKETTMYNTFSKKLLIAIIVALPALSAAADVTPATEPKAAAPAPVAVSAPQAVATENKPAAATPAQSSAKIGYVDVGRIGVDSEKGKALRTVLSNKKDQLQSKIDEKKKQIEKLKASIEAKIETMTPKQREAKSKEFQKKLEELQKFGQSAEEEFFKFQEKETSALFEEIEKSAADYGKANGFSVIVIKKELLYIGSSVDVQDVTDALIKALNETGQKK